jgi:hypothetical protein
MCHEANAAGIFFLCGLVQTVLGGEFEWVCSAAHVQKPIRQTKMRYRSAILESKIAFAQQNKWGQIL